MAARILVLDIETAPVKSYIWRLWKETVGINQIISDWYIISWAAKWLGEEDIYYDALPNHKTNYKKDPEDDSKILRSLRPFLDEADIIIAHYGSRFDLPKIRARFVYHSMDVPSPSRVIDTAIIARKQFSFTSSKLDYLGEFLGVGRKEKHEGFELWSKCIDGDHDAWERMITYNLQDVKLLEEVYLKLRPWIPNHPNLGLYIDEEIPVCTACGSDELVKNGHAYTSVGKYQRYKCTSCGHHMRERTRATTKEKSARLLTNAL